MKKTVSISILVVVISIYFFAPSSAFGEIHVYGANNDFLGYFISFVESGDEILIYVPSLGKFIQFEHFSDSSAPGKVRAFVVSYGASDCAGETTYMYIGDYPFGSDKYRYFIVRNCSKFYTFSNESGDSVYYQALSVTSDYEACTACGNINDWGYGYPITEVTLPFDHPIALPLRFEIKIGNKTVVIPMFK